MSDIRYALSMIKRNRGESILYIISIIIGISILTLFQGIIQNESFITKTGDFYTALNIESFEVTIAIGALILFTSNNLAYRKMKEYAIILLSGRSYLGLASIIVLENLILSIVGSFIGILLGGVGLLTFNNLLNVSMNYKEVLFLVSTIVVALLIFITTISIFLNLGLVERHTIDEMLNGEKSIYTPSNYPIMINHNVHLLICVVFAVIPLIVPYNVEGRASFGLLCLLPCIIGVFGLMVSTIPRYIFKLKKMKFSYKSEGVIILGNLHHLSNKMGVFLAMLIAVIISNLYFIILVNDNKKYLSILLGCFTVIIVIFSIINFYNVITQLIGRSNAYKQLILLGYSEGIIKKILAKEVMLILILITGIPIVLITPTVVMATISNVYNYKTIIYLYSAFIGINIIVGMILCKMYKKIVLGKVNVMK